MSGENTWVAYFLPLNFFPLRYPGAVKSHWQSCEKAKRCNEARHSKTQVCPDSATKTQKRVCKLPPSTRRLMNKVCLVSEVKGVCVVPFLELVSRFHSLRDYRNPQLQQSPLHQPPQIEDVGVEEDAEMLGVEEGVGGPHLY